MKVPTDVIQYLHLGLQLALTMLAMTALGWWLDDKAGTTPWLLIVGAFLGLTAGLYQLIRQVTSGIVKKPPKKDDQ